MSEKGNGIPIFKKLFEVSIFVIPVSSRQENLLHSLIEATAIEITAAL